MVSQVFKGVWKERIRENAVKKGLGSYYRSQRRFCAKKREDISIIKSRKRESLGVCKESVEKGIY